MSKNKKPSKIFDKKYGTKLSQRYKYPLGFNNADRVWESDKETFNLLAKNLTQEHFNFNGINKLNLRTKKDILYGMASGFNEDDIIWFAIKKNIGCSKESLKIQEQLTSLLTKLKINNDVSEIMNDIEWVISPTTANKIFANFLALKIYKK